MSKFNPPKELSFEGNLSENWERWKKEFKFYLTATESDEKGDDVKTSRLLTTIGEKARDVYYTFTFATEGDDMKLDPVIAKFDEYFSPRKNLPYTRFKFFTYNQTNGQTIDEYVTELKSRSRHCEFGSLKESLIRDRIVAGIQDAKVRERLLRETDLSLDKAISICTASKATKKQLEEMATSPVVDNVDSINNFQRRESRDSRNPTTQRPRQDRPEMTRNNDQSRARKYCGNMHQRGRCPAYGRMCNKCRKWNHFASVCQSKSVSNIEQEQSSSDEKTEFFVGTVQGDENDGTMPWTMQILTSGTNVSYKLDTGSQVNIIPQKTYHALQKKPKLYTATEKLIGI